MANPTGSWAPRLGALIACLALVSCARTSPEEAYRRAWASYAAGDLTVAARAATEGAARWRQDRNSPWFWQFRLLEAEILAAQANRKQAAALLEDPVPPAPELAQLEVRRLIDLASLGSQPRARTAELIERARAAVRDPELAIRLDLVEGVAAINQRRLEESHAAFRRAADAAARQGNLYWQAQALSNLSVSAKALQQYEESIDVGLKALAAAEQAGARRVAALAHGNLGSSYAYLGDFPSANDHQRKAIRIFEAMGARSNLMIALGELGLMFDRQEDPEQAISHYQRAYAIARELHMDRDAARHAENLSTTLIKSRRWDEAEEWNRRAAETAASMGARDMRPYLERNRAWIAYGRGRPEEAAAICRALLRENPDQPGIVWAVHALLGQIDSEAGRFPQAVASFEKALGIIEGTRSDLLNSHYRITILSRLIPFYRDYVETLARRNDDARALRVVESSRARVLSERLGRDLGVQRFPGVARLRRFAAANRAALLAFWLAPRASYAWLATAEGVRRFPLPPAAEIEKLVDRKSVV